MADGYNVETLTEIRDNASAMLAEISRSPKPDYNINGQSVSWNAYREQLMAQIQWASNEIVALGGPSEQETIAT